jgi:SAM-dependent methyltransferase
VIRNLRPHFFPPEGRLRVLDLGAGAGDTSVALKQRAYDIVAFDLDRALLKEIAARDATMPLVAGNGVYAPFRDGCFDRVLMLELLEHVPDPAAILFEARRVLAHSGVAVVAVPTSYSERFYWRVHPRYAANATHVRIFGRHQLERLATQAGFDVVAIETRNLAPAAAWFVHSIIRTDADHTGRVLEHHRVDQAVYKAFRRCRRVPMLTRVLSFLEARVGKSWYLYLRPSSRD